MSWPATLVAQTAQDVLPPTREEVLRPVTPTAISRAPRIEVEGGVERAPCALDGPDFKSIHLTLRGVEFAGLKGLTSEQMASAYAPFLGRDVPISVVCEIRDRAGTILRNAGYIAAVQVPEQRIGDGNVRFQVLMAHMTQVRVRGDASGAERVIAGYLNKLTQQAVFNRNDAERYLLLAGDLPGYTVRLTLRPAGTVPGEVVGDVTVQRLAAYVDANVQNSGSESLGPWGALVRGQVFGLTGLGDRTTLSLFTTSDFKEQQTVQLGHDFRLGSEGLSAGGAFTYAWARPTIPDANVLARTLLATAEVGYPFVRRQAETIRGSAGLDFVNQDVKLDGLPLSRDRLRVGFIRLGFDSAKTDFDGSIWSAAEPPWRFNSLVEIRQGLPILGATDCGMGGVDCTAPGAISPSRLEGRADATVLRYSFNGEFRPVPRITFALGARAQYAWQPLLSFEEFSAGNYTAGRGYDPGTLLGDRGFGTQAEIRVGSRVPQSAHRPAIEGYAFWDHAMVRNLDLGGPLFPGPDQIDSVGGGARVNFDRFVVDAAVAVPLTRVGPANERPDPRVLVSLTSRLWPWSYR
ncbi:MAG: ShlB/FhaC/HecB family hemolysin secretion/activation protein [Sphingomicrobium sp.]